MSRPIATLKKIEIVIAVVASVSVFYVLSSGPVLYLVRHKIMSERAANLVYQPLDSLTGWHPYIVYVQWWYYTKAEREHMYSTKHD